MVGLLLLPDSLPTDTRAAPAGSAAAAATAAVTGAPLPPPAAVPLTGTIAVGDGEPVLSVKVKAGKAATITAPEDGPAAGLVLMVPEGAYEAKRTFQVSAAPLDVDGFDGAVTPISPLYTIDNGGGYAAEPIEVTIPVTIPAGSFAMAFYLLDDGSLEAIPVVEESATSITIVTRHFSSFFVSMIKEAMLPDTVGTGFRAGEDDFASPNHGSYIAPGGHCAGQSLASMWYFAERRSQGAPPLHTLYSGSGAISIADRWEDDRDIYRLASSVQADQQLGLLYKFERGLKTADFHRTAWLSFRYAMHVTGQPQYVSLSVKDQAGGHALVAYGYTPYGLFVADPNWPGQLRSIHWNPATARFDPYASAQSAEDSARMYDQVMFYAKSSLIDWGRIAARWADLEAGGNGVDRFPVLLVEAMTGLDAAGQETWDPLYDGMALTGSTVRLRAVSYADAGLGRVTLYADADRSYSVLGTLTAGYPQALDLGYGTFQLGLYQTAVPPFEATYEAVDFQVVTITTGPPPSFTPAPPEQPLPTPEATFDCSVEPSGQIGKLNWSLHCEGIEPQP